MKRQTLIQKIKRIFLTLCILFLVLLQTNASLKGNLLFSNTLAEGNENEKTIDLSMFIKDSSAHIQGAWMLNSKDCVVLYQLQETRGMELMVFNTQDDSLLLSAHIDHAVDLREHTWEDDTLCLWIESDNTEQRTLLRTNIAQDCKINTESQPYGMLYMPGGDIAIHSENDGSLSQQHLASNESKLLLQGVPSEMIDEGAESRYEKYLKYLPCADDVGYDEEELQYPVDEKSFYENDILFIRSFHASDALDANRFVYSVHGWEWGAGFGVYDVSTQSDRRITGTGDYFGRRGNILYGTNIMADCNSYEIKQLPTSISEQFEEVMAMEDGIILYDISADGKYLALTGLRSRKDGASDIAISDMATGDAVFTRNFAETDAEIYSVSFYAENNLMLLYTVNNNWYIKTLENVY